jgi:hypothetical protein
MHRAEDAMKQTVEMDDREWQQLLTILVTKETQWLVSNPIITKISQQTQPKNPEMETFATPGGYVKYPKGNSDDVRHE